MLPEELISRTRAASRPDSVVPTTIPGLQVVHSEGPTFPKPSMYHPSLCLVVQGEKEVTIGGRPFPFGAGQCLVVPVSLPVTARVVQAPFLSLALELDPDQIYAILQELEPGPLAADPAPATLRPMAVDAPMTGAFLRLLQCLDRSEDARILAPLVQKELLYRLLQSKQAGLVRPLGLPASQTRRVAKAIEHLRAHFHESIAMDELARRVNLSPSAFFLHFKRVTSISPLRYQKELRLQEARRLLVTEEADAASAAYQVGYESPSQFSRDYARMFGLPPGADRKRLATGTTVDRPPERPVPRGVSSR